MTPYQSSASTKRMFRQIAPVPTLFALPAADAGAQIGRGPWPEGRSRLMLVGSRSRIADLRAWAVPPSLPDGWEPGEHYLNTASPVLRYNGPDGRRLEVIRAAAWFGEGEYGTLAAHQAWAELGAVVGASFHGASLLSSPATTGRELLLRTIPRDVEWPVLDDEHQELIRATSGQGRIEVLPDPLERDRIPIAELVELDGRLMYAALCWELPGALELHDNLPDFAGKRRARYRVRVTPDRWHQFGLLGVKAGDTAWQYPVHRGDTFETWCDGSELALVFEYAPGWHVEILERLIFEGYRGRGPLDTWKNKLVAIYERSRDELVRAALRSIVLHSIGAFHGRGQVVTHVRGIDEEGTTPGELARLEGDHLIFEENRGQAWKQLAHPEWSACIWARARARLLRAPGDRGALHLDPATIVGFRTDALYLTEDPRWADTGKVGQFRVKRRVAGPMPWPRTNTELLRLRDGA